MKKAEYTNERLLDDSRERVVKNIERELDTIRKAAETDHSIFQYQTILWAFKRKLEEI